MNERRSIIAFQADLESNYPFLPSELEDRLVENHRQRDGMGDIPPALVDEVEAEAYFSGNVQLTDKEVIDVLQTLSHSRNEFRSWYLEWRAKK